MHRVKRTKRCADESHACPVRSSEAGCRVFEATKVAFLTWTARNPLKSPESDEEIQENPSPFSWSGVDWLWFGLEEFGPRRCGVGRPLLARLSTRVDEARRPGRSEIRPGSYKVAQFGAQDVEIARVPIDLHVRSDETETRRCHVIASREAAWRSRRTQSACRADCFASRAMTTFFSVPHGSLFC
jgi:hypothetical protein